MFSKIPSPKQPQSQVIAVSAVWLFAKILFAGQRHWMGENNV